MSSNGNRMQREKRKETQRRVNREMYAKRQAVTEWERVEALRMRKKQRERARIKEQKKQRFLAGGVFFSFPGSLWLFDTEEEARKLGGDQVKRFEDAAAAIEYARGEQGGTSEESK